MLNDSIQAAKDEMVLRNYSPKTIQAYTAAIREYLVCHPAGERFCHMEDLRRFLLEKQGKGYAPQTVNLYLNALKFYYLQFLKLRFKINLKFVKRSKKLPVVLSHDEIERILDAVNNYKHKIMLALAYGAGLRVSEVVRIKVQDVQFGEGTIHVKQAKGKKDRLTILPEKLEKDLLVFAQNKI